MSTEAQHFVNLLSPYIHSYGYLVAFFGMMLENAGIPVPAETALIVLSFFAGQGLLKIWLVIPIAIVGDAVGDNIGFWIGRLGGRRLVEKYGRYVRIDKAKLEAMESLFSEKGGRTVFTAHFFSTTRITAALIAGISHMRYKRFLAFNVAAAGVFVTLVAGATFYFGKNLDATLRFFHLFRLVGLSIAVVLVTAYLYRFYQQKKHLHKRLGIKIIAATTVTSILVGLLVYAISGALIIVPRTGAYAGLTHGSVRGASFTVERGFISDIENDGVLVTALGLPAIKFQNIRRKAFVTLTVGNIGARETVAKSSSAVRKPVALDSLTLSMGVSLEPGRRTEVALAPRVTTKRFDFAVAGDTRDAGPVFDQLVSAVNSKRPAFVIHAGDFVKDGEKRKYRGFLDQIAALREPIFTAVGVHELLDKGGPTYGKLFGPRNYSFAYQGSTFVILDTSKESIKDVDLGWLEGELRKAKGSRNLFIVTYAIPFGSNRFDELLAEFNVKAVYAVKTMGGEHPPATRAELQLLEHQPQARYLYKLVTVDQNKLSDVDIKITPRGLSFVQKVMLRAEELKREITNLFSR